MCEQELEDRVGAADELEGRLQELSVAVRAAVHNPNAIKPYLAELNAIAPFAVSDLLNTNWSEPNYGRR